MLLKIKDFEFEPFKHDGDSGQKYIATRKSDGKRFMVKHGKFECACNEYLWYSIARELGLKVLDFHLFEEDESGELFKSMYAIAIEFVEGRALIDFKKDRPRIKNWQDYFGFHALFAAFSEEDGWEIRLGEDGYIYRIDTTASFQLNEESIFAKLAMREMFPPAYIQSLIQGKYEQLKEVYPKDIGLFVDTLRRLTNLSRAKISKHLDVVCKLYTPHMKKVYLEYFDACREAIAGFLKNQ